LRAPAFEQILIVIREKNRRRAFDVFQRIQGFRRPLAAATPVGGLAVLGRGGVGLRGVVASVGAGARPGCADAAELERRLLEIGFVEGARVEILHQGAVGGDPIAVRLDDMSVALRRREADAVMVRVSSAGRRVRVRAA
jgi:ferrous iron transport protein A